MQGSIVILQSMDQRTKKFLFYLLSDCILYGVGIFTGKMIWEKTPLTFTPSHMVKWTGSVLMVAPGSHQANDSVPYFIIYFKNSDGTFFTFLDNHRDGSPLQAAQGREIVLTYDKSKEMVESFEDKKK